MPPLRQFDTGYTYAAIGDTENREEDLKCGYLLSSLRNMQLTRVQLAHPLAKTILTLNNIKLYLPVIKDKLATLYELNIPRYGALWLVLLYTGSAEDYKNTLYNSGYTKQEVHAKLLSIHDYVIGKLESDASGCREGNRFDQAEMPFTARQLGKPEGITHLINSHKNYIRRLLNFNYDNCHLSFDHNSKFEINKLFMFNFGTIPGNVIPFMTRYNVKIDWSNTGAHLQATWFNARDLDWTTNDLQPIKLYLTTVFDFIKVIFLRLTAKHLFYLLDVKVPHRHIFVQEWFILLQRFANIFVFVNDTHIAYLLEAFNSGLIVHQNNIESLIKYLNKAVSRTSDTLGCTANEPITITDLANDIMLLPRGTPIANTDEDRLRIRTHTIPIAEISLMNAYDFMDLVKWTFRNIHFDVTKLLVDYIDGHHEFRLF
ncbi:uncharacterized protein LOC126833827 [Adelges cooleyi]|uniref:uncharacterized protein LOC126833827 n=1 Tax=Adelges cooleyi TaxID=133065 RepID=UPI0021807D50|nr:uncharacterized protein LOC126833827 [Adelges cooleyi]